MAYTPTEWKDGDIITAERLNKLEAGVQNEQVGRKAPRETPAKPARRARRVILEKLPAGPRRSGWCQRRYRGNRARRSRREVC